MKTSLPSNQLCRIKKVSKKLLTLTKMLQRQLPNSEKAVKQKHKSPVLRKKSKLSQDLNCFTDKGKMLIILLFCPQNIPDVQNSFKKT